MKNVFVEGIQGMGKSTLVNRLAGVVPRLRAIREGDYSPVELAWCALMTGEEYGAVLERFAALREEIIRHTVQEGENRIVMYTKIRTDEPDFYRTLEQYEIYNGRKTLEAFREIVLTRHRRCRETGMLMECAFFQNIIEELILYQQCSDDEIVAFYRELFARVDQENFLLLYLYSDEVEACIDVIRRERCDAQGNEVWYQMMMQFLRECSYGRAHGSATSVDLAAHFRHRQRLELRIIREVIGQKAVVLPAKAWNLQEVAALATA